MTTPTYRVERSDPQQVRDAVIALWRDNLGTGINLGKKFDWIYGSTATMPADIYLLYTNTQDEPVGAYGLVPRQFNVNGQHINAAVLSDLVVDKKHRTLYPAMKLQKTVLEEGGQRYQLIYGFPNKNAKPIFLRLGYRVGGMLRRYAMVIDVGDKLAARLSSPALARLIAPTANATLRLLASLRNTENIRCETVGWNDPRIAAWQQLATSPAPIAAMRTQEAMHQRFAKNPRGYFELIGLLSKDNTLLGYAVAHIIDNVMYIDDLQVASATASAALVAIGCEASARKLKSVNIELLDTPATNLVTDKARFRGRESREMFYFASKDSPLRDALAQSEDWYITSADEDQ